MPQQTTNDLLIPEPSGSRRGWVFAGLAIIVTSLGLAGFAAYRGQQSLVHSHTAVTGRIATGLVKDYVETHEGRWPRSWEDLAKMERDTEWIPVIKQRVVIDFAADPARLARQQKDEFTAIRPVKAPFGSYNDYWETESLLETLRKHHPLEDKQISP
jgi:hypothetical protein